MNQRYFIAALALAGLLTPALSVIPAQSQAPVQTGRKQASVVHGQQQHQDEGERIFNQNCSRCHRTPEGFPPSISGTIVRHMRVRASLSQHDEQELLRFFNP
jgi:cytochrome c5